MADASALAEYLLRTTRAAPLAEVIEAPETDLHVPALCDVEFVAALRRALLSGSLRASRARTALADYLDLSLLRHGHQRLLSRALELRENFSAYDATYAALAERMDAALLTADERLRRAVRRHLQVEVLP